MRVARQWAAVHETVDSGCPDSSSKMGMAGSSVSVVPAPAGSHTGIEQRSNEQKRNKKRVQEKVRKENNRKEEGETSYFVRGIMTGVSVPRSCPRHRHMFMSSLMHGSAANAASHQALFSRPTAGLTVQLCLGLMSTNGQA